MKYGILQFRRIKRFSNQANLIEMAQLIQWDKRDRGELTTSPVQDEIENPNSVIWKFMGTITLTDQEWKDFKNSLYAQFCYFTDDIK